MVAKWRTVPALGARDLWTCAMYALMGIMVGAVIGSLAGLAFRKLPVPLTGGVVIGTLSLIAIIPWAASKSSRNLTMILLAALGWFLLAAVGAGIGFVFGKTDPLTFGIVAGAAVALLDLVVLIGAIFGDAVLAALKDGRVD